MQHIRQTIIGHAIISADGFIADTEGRMPKPLMIDADWQRFQAELDASDKIGRASCRERVLMPV